jgi:hypothetical protein
MHTKMRIFITMQKLLKNLGGRKLKDKHVNANIKYYSRQQRKRHKDNEEKQTKERQLQFDVEFLVGG